MTTKTGEKLRGRKRDPSVLEKAWETRRANNRKDVRAAKRALASMTPATKAIGSTTRTPIRKVPKRRSKASTGRKATRSRSNASLEATRTLVAIAQDLLIREFIVGIEECTTPASLSFKMPRSAVEAVIRRLKSTGASDF